MKRIALLLMMLTLTLFCTACHVDYPDPGSVGLEEEAAAPPNLFSFTEGFNFLFISDTQAALGTGDYSDLQTLMTSACAEEHNLSFILHGGDVVNTGMDAEGNLLDEWPAFTEAMAPAGDLPVRVTWGDEDDDTLLSHFSMEQNGPDELLNHFYSFSYENAHFIFLDGTLMGLHRQEYQDWLRSDITATDKEWNIVICHYSLYPTVLDQTAEERATAQREIWESLYQELGVDLVLCGYQGAYSRTYPIYQGAESEDGVIYITAASGVNQATAVQELDYVAASAVGTPNYCLFNINGNALTMKAYDMEGTLLDTLELTKE